MVPISFPFLKPFESIPSCLCNFCSTFSEPNKRKLEKPELLFCIWKSKYKFWPKTAVCTTKHRLLPEKKSLLRIYYCFCYYVYSPRINVSGFCSPYYKMYRYIYNFPFLQPVVIALDIMEKFILKFFVFYIKRKLS